MRRRNGVTRTCPSLPTQIVRAGANSAHRRRYGLRMRRATASGERELLLAISIVVFVDTMLYSVLAPLLPGLVHSLGLSKSSAGVMTACYPLGTLIGSLPGGVLAVRAGPRFTVCTGLTLLAGSTIAFGCCDSVVALDVARVVEGVGGACSWAGGLAWIVVDTPADRRGAVIGTAMSAAVAGALLGPVIGSVATATGRPASFLALAAGVTLLLAWASRRPSRHHRSEQGFASVLRVFLRREVAAAMWLIGLPAIGSGMLNVLGPLRLHRFGVAAAGVGATFLVAAALEASLSPHVGRISDRHGRLVPLRAGLIAATVALLCFTLPGKGLGLAVVVVLIACSLGVFWAPAMAMVADVAATLGLDQGLAAALMNLAWAGGQIVGSGGGGALAKSGGDGVPMDAVATLCVLTLLALSVAPARRRTRRAARR
jgi:MFS family permease